MGFKEGVVKDSWLYFLKLVVGEGSPWVEPTAVSVGSVYYLQTFRECTTLALGVHEFVTTQRVKAKERSIRGVA